MQDMKTVAAFFALSLAAAAQTLIGPNTGPVFLKGDPNNPILVNHSGKTILIAVFVSSPSNIVHVEFFGDDSSGAKLIKNNEERAGMRNAVEHHRVMAGDVVVSAPGMAVTANDLDLVIFTDGEIVGPDKTKTAGDPKMLGMIQKSAHAGLKLWRAK